MSGTPSLNDSDKALLYLIALRYLLAGNLESLDLLNSLDEQLKAIDWNDPEFIRRSDDMRSGTPRLTADQESSLRAPLLALIHLLTERDAATSEMLVQVKAGLKTFIEEARRDAPHLNAVRTGLVAFTSEVIKQHAAMRDRLQVLGASTSEFELPDLNKFIPPSPPT